MKKTLLLSAAALYAAMGMNAEERVYDFNQVAPQLAIDLYLPEEDPYYGYGKTGNVEIIDKVGTPCASWLEDMTSLQSKENDTWVCDATKAVDMETGELVNYADANLDHSLLVWGEKGVARVLLMAGWGSTDGAVGGAYQAATEADYIATKNALAFNRNSNSGCRQDTYFQIPNVTPGSVIDMYIGSQGTTEKKNYCKELKVKVVPVVNGVEQEAEFVKEERYISDTSKDPDKRMFKQTYTYNGTETCALRLGCDGEELALYHIVIKSDGAGVENVALDAAAENAPIYNTLGVQVDENYKGLVIKGGKKYIQK